MDCKGDGVVGGVLCGVDNTLGCARDSSGKGVDEMWLSCFGGQLSGGSVVVDEVKGEVRLVEQGSHWGRDGACVEDDEDIGWEDG